MSPEISRRTVRILALAALALVFDASPLAGQDFTAWFNDRIDEVLASRLGQRSGARETEVPSIARSSTGLVDRSGASDLVGLALNGAPLTRGEAGDVETSSTAVTVTPYALLAGVLGIDPNDPFLYEERSAWRAISITLGTEDAEVGEDGATVRSTLLGLKVRIWSERTPDPSSAAVRNLRGTLGGAAAAAGPLSGALVDSLHAWAGAFTGYAPDADRETHQRSRAAFNNDVLRDRDRFPGILRYIGEEREDILLDMIEARIEPFLAHRRAANEVVAELRGEPQLALDVQGRIRPSGGDDYRVGLALDLGLADQLHWVLNAGASFVLGAEGSEDAAGGTISSGLTYDLRRPGLTGADPPSLEVAFEGEFLEERGPSWRVQGKFMLPVTQGLVLPLSVTWANRTDLIDESEVVGRVGFTLDTARLLAAFAEGGGG